MGEWSYLEEHYNKFCEDKRLTRRHGQVEYITTMKYISKYLEELRASKNANNIKILDIGAGTGAYSIPLANEGYDVTAIELVKYNVGVLKSKGSTVKARQGNALRLKNEPDNEYDVVLVLGPMYHLFKEEDKVKVLQEARRVVKLEGVIFVAYLMNEYSIIRHGFMENNICECIEAGQVDDDFHVKNSEKDLYDYVRIDDIDRLNGEVGLERIQIIASTGVANYIRSSLNVMDEATFDKFIQFHLLTCERGDLIGASSHVVDILRKVPN